MGVRNHMGMVRAEHPPCHPSSGRARRKPAERARHVGLRLATLPDARPPRAAAGLDDLLHALVTDAERLGHLSERRPGEVELADGVVVVGLRHLGFAFGRAERLAGGLGDSEELVVEDHEDNVYVDRQNSQVALAKLRLVARARLK